MERAVFLAVLIVNAAGFVLMGLDKLLAWRGRRRVPEPYFYCIAAFTGAPGVWLGSILFRHKSAKRSFLWKLTAATAVNVVWFLLWWRQ